MVRLGLGFCAVVFTIMLLIPRPLQPVSQRAAAAAPEQAAPAPQLRIGAPRVIASLASMADADRFDVPAPAMPLGATIAGPAALPALPDPQPPLPPADGRIAAPKLEPPDGGVPRRIYRVAAPAADLRAGPSALERRTGALRSGDRVEVLSRYADRWFFVRLADGETEGYLDATLLSPAN